MPRPNRDSEIQQFNAARVRMCWVFNLYAYVKHMLIIEIGLTQIGIKKSNTKFFEAGVNPWVWKTLYCIGKIKLLRAVESILLCSC